VDAEDPKALASWSGPKKEAARPGRNPLTSPENVSRRRARERLRELRVGIGAVAMRAADHLAEALRSSEV